MRKFLNFAVLFGILIAQNAFAQAPDELPPAKKYDKLVSECSPYDQAGIPACDALIAHCEKFNWKMCHVKPVFYSETGMYNYVMTGYTVACLYSPKSDEALETCRNGAYLSLLFASIKDEQNFKAFYNALNKVAEANERARKGKIIEIQRNNEKHYDFKEEE